MLNTRTSSLEFENRIDVDHADWLHQKNHILALTVTCRIQFAAIIILATALGFVMFAEPRLDQMPYSGTLVDTDSDRTKR